MSQLESSRLAWEGSVGPRTAPITIPTDDRHGPTPGALKGDDYPIELDADGDSILRPASTVDPRTISHRPRDPRAAEGGGSFARSCTEITQKNDAAS
jgi:hypothetical protein